MLSPRPMLLGVSLAVITGALASIMTTGADRTGTGIGLVAHPANIAPQLPASSGRAPARPLSRRAARSVHHAAITRPRAPAPISIARMVGQELMVRMSGLVPDPGLLDRIRRGQVGGVILYSDNVTSSAQTASLVADLQRAAWDGGNPPLLISTDQEGGEVKRLPWAPPAMSAQAMGAQGQAVSESQGALTGEALHAVGINVDLAPVVDVAHSASSFIWQQNRSFGMTAGAVTATAVPFALGMQQAGVAPTAKHFPGLGAALTDTDYAQQTLNSSPEDLGPYGLLIADNIPLIMVSTGVYPSLDSTRTPAALSRPIIGGLLRGQLGYRGVVITDDLERPTGYSTSTAVVKAAAAGADIILVSTTEEGGATAYAAMLAAVDAGTVPRLMVRQAYDRIRQLKMHYADHAAAI